MSMSSEISCAKLEIARWQTLIKKHDKCRMRVKKYKVTKKSELDRLFHKFTTDKNTFNHYLTEGRVDKTILSKFRDEYGNELVKHPLDKDESIKEESVQEVYKLPLEFVERGAEKHDMKSIDRREFGSIKDTKSSLKDNIRDRIFIPEKYALYKGITDVDEKYFSIVQNRCKKRKFSVKSYINYLRESLRLRLQTGYVFDEIFKLKEQSEIERNKLNCIKSLLKNHTAAFDEFLATDHNDSMKLLIMYAEAVFETDTMRKHLKNKMSEVTKLRFNIYELEDTWRRSKMCEEFLLSFFAVLSGKPSSYYLNMKYETRDSSDSAEVDVISNSESLASLLQFMSPTVVNKNVDINMTNPLELLEIFTHLEHQCLDYLIFTELLEKPSTAMSMHLDCITLMYNMEISLTSQRINQLTNVISFIEQNNKVLEDHVHKLVHSSYKESFEGAEESIILNEYLKQSYAKCVSGCEATMTSQSLMNALAMAYTEMLLEMDSLPTDLVKKLVKQVQHRDAVRLKLGRNARRRVHELEVLTTQMLRLFKPVTADHGRKLMYRSLPPVKKNPPPPEPKEITQAEKEYLLLFTDFCPYTDDADSYLAAAGPLPKLTDS